jgi:hypothetical protein
MAHFGKKGLKRRGGTGTEKEQQDEFVKRVRAEISAKESEYRRRSLEIHPWVCAKCGREFDAGNLHLLTVHHRDGNHNNNPPDGSNWENLCVYCHDDEHSRTLLADLASEGGPETESGGGEPATRGPGLGTMASALGKFLKRKS